VNTPRPTLGRTPATLWQPKRFRQFDEFLQSTPSAFAGADAETKMDSTVAAIAHAFSTHGFAAGMNEARRYGLEGPARAYVEMRAETEEQLAVRLARVTADLVRRPDDRLLQALRAFVEVRLAQVRAAVAKAQTPPPSVADRPEVPRKEVHRWVPYVALAISAVALLRSR
jgi:hypothetical protein